MNILGDLHDSTQSCAVIACVYHVAAIDEIARISSVPPSWQAFQHLRI